MKKYLEANDLLKFTIMQALNNPIKTFLINLNVISCCIYLLNIFEYPKHYQHQYYHNRLKNYTNTHIIQFFSYYKLKNLLTLSKRNEAAFVSESLILKFFISILSTDVNPNIIQT